MWAHWQLAVAILLVAAAGIYLLRQLFQPASGCGSCGDGSCERKATGESDMVQLELPVLDESLER